MPRNRPDVRIGNKNSYPLVDAYFCYRERSRTERITTANVIGIVGYPRALRDREV